MAPKKRKVDEEADDVLSLSNNSPESKPEAVEYEHEAAEERDDEGGEDEQEEEEPEEDEEEEEEDVGRLLETLSRDQLIGLLRSAAASDSRTLDEIRSAADQDPAQRKLFVHSLGWDTTSDVLRAAFSPYGDIEDCRVVLDKSTGRSKGYGFVLFRHRASARRALRSPQKLIDNRMTACQLASTGPPSFSAAPAANSHSSHPNPNFNPKPTPHDNLPRKIYVGNVHPDVDGGRLRAFFARYGEIEEGPLGFDRPTGKSKGFALFVYRTVEGARKALEDPNKNFEGHLLHCQKATDSNKSKAAYAGATHAATPNTQGNNGGYNGSGYGGPPAEMGMAQQAAMMGQGILGMGGTQPFGQGMQPNAPALAAMLAAAGQNPAAFGFTPAMLASVNHAFAAALGAGVPAVVPSTAQTQGYGMGNVAYQNAGFQGPPGFQGHPVFQGTMPPSGPNQGAGGGSYQGGAMGQGSMARPPMGGY